VAESSFGLLLVLALVLVAEFLNGCTDAPNAIATVVSTRVLSPGQAVLLAVFFNVIGALAGTAVAATIELATRLGVPLSTTHTITTSILGVGATRRFSAIRWCVTREIVLAWIITFPACGAIGYLAATIVRRV
jgi:PiT family inorganic phosphate transporter